MFPVELQITLPTGWKSERTPCTREVLWRRSVRLGCMFLPCPRSVSGLDQGLGSEGRFEKCRLVVNPSSYGLQGQEALVPAVDDPLVHEMWSDPPHSHYRTL